MASSVYFIQGSHGGPIKIGAADRPEKRLAQLQIASPARLVLLRAVPGSAREEAFLHQRFASSRVRGEWFEATDELLRVISSRPFDWDAVVPHHARADTYFAADQCEICGFRLDIEYADAAERPSQCRACIAAAPYRETPESEENTVTAWLG